MKQVNLRNFLGILLFVSVTGWAQADCDAFDVLFKKVEHFYAQTPRYSFSTLYTYTSADSLVNSEHYEGKVQKNGDDYYNMIGSTEFIQIAQHHLKINHQQKAIQYEQKEHIQKYTPLQLTPLIGMFESISVKKEKHQYVCELTFLESSLHNFKAMYLWIDLKDFFLKEQTLLINNPSRKIEKTDTLTISYGTPILKSDPLKFRLSNYLGKEPNPQLTNQYAQYALYNANQ